MGGLILAGLGEFISSVPSLLIAHGSWECSQVKHQWKGHSPAPCPESWREMSYSQLSAQAVKRALLLQRAAALPPSLHLQDEMDSSQGA